MSLDVTYGNIHHEEAIRLAAATDVDWADHRPGDTEPWISQLVAAFIIARGARTVLETGCYTGATSRAMVGALQALGGGKFHGCEIDLQRRTAVAASLPPCGAELHADVLQYLATTTDRFDLAWVDDNHEKKHVQRELELLYPKMTKGGLILLHDVFGQCDLNTVVTQWGGYSIDLPRLGPAGGLGVIQVR